MKQEIQEFIDGILAQQKNNLFLWAPFFFAVGIATYFGLKFEPPLWLGISLSSLLFCGLFFLSKRQDDNAITKLSFLLLMAVTLALIGFSVAQVKTHLVYTPMLVKKMPTVEVIGTIEAIEPSGGKDGSRVILSDVEVERLSASKTPRKIRIKIRKDEGLQTGQRVKIFGGLNPAGGPVAPNAFDFQRMAYFQGIGAVGFAYNAPEILSNSGHSASWLSAVRGNITSKIKAVTSAPQQAVVVALMTGQRAAIADDDWDALRQSGLAHLLTISGLHVGMVAGVLFFFVRLFLACFPRLALHYPIKKWAALIAIVGALFYTLIVGATIPTQRALMMTGVVMVAIMFDRSPFSLRLVGLAALVVLLFSPQSLTSVSFQMSFAAVVALIYFYEKIRNVWVGAHRQAGFFRKCTLYFIGVSLTTIVAGTATGLFSLYHFQNYAAYGVLANLVAVPLMGFLIMPFIVLSYVLMLVGLEQWPLELIEWGVGWVLATAHWVAGMEGAVWHIPTWPHWIFVSMVCCAWFWIVWKGRLKLITVPIFTFLLGLIFLYKQPDIIISSKIDLVAMRDDSGSLWFSNGRKERYSADQWMRLNGHANENKLKFPKEGKVDDFPLRCGYYGCRGEVEGQKISIAYHVNAWQEDCGWADIIISKAPVPDWKCDAGYIIDFFDVWRKGAHAVWLSPNRVKIKNVEGERGLRPWTQTSANNKINDKSE